MCTNSLKLRQPANTRTHTLPHSEPAQGLVVDRQQPSIRSVIPGYILMPSQIHGALQVILGALEQGHSVMFYCKAGKDRTGIVAALLLSVLGASDDAIIRDYVLYGPLSALLASLFCANMHCCQLSDRTRPLPSGRSRRNLIRSAGFPGH